MKTKKQDLLFEWNNKNLFGERLIFLRKRRALTQQELADILFVSKYTISSYEHGKTTPDDCSKIMLAKFFDVSLDYLFGLIDTAVSYERSDTCIHLPDNFSDSQRNQVQEYVEFLKFLDKQV